MITAISKRSTHQVCQISLLNAQGNIWGGYFLIFSIYLSMYSPLFSLKSFPVFSLICLSSILTYFFQYFQHFSNLLYFPRLSSLLHFKSLILSYYLLNSLGSLNFCFTLSFSICRLSVSQVSLRQLSCVTLLSSHKLFYSMGSSKNQIPNQKVREMYFYQ